MPPSITALKYLLLLIFPLSDVSIRALSLIDGNMITRLMAIFIAPRLRTLHSDFSSA
jgi:hypothetical protein